MNSMRYLRRSSFMVGGVVKGEFHNLFTRLWKLHSRNVFDFILYFCLFYTYSKATDQPHVNGSPNLEFMLENNFKSTFHTVKFIDALFPVFKKNNCRHQNNFLLSLLNTYLRGQIRNWLIWDGWYLLSQFCAVHYGWVLAAFISVLF